MRSIRITVVLMIRHTSLDHRQLHTPSASSGATSAFQRVQRTDNAKDRAIEILRKDQKASRAAVTRSSCFFGATWRPKTPSSSQLRMVQLYPSTPGLNLFLRNVSTNSIGIS